MYITLSVFDTLGSAHYVTRGRHRCSTPHHANNSPRTICRISSQGYDKDNLADALRGADVVIIPAGVPRKPGMTRDDLFKVSKASMRAC